MFAKPSHSRLDFRRRCVELRKLVFRLSAFVNNDISDVLIEKDMSGFLIKIVSGKFRSLDPGSGLIKVNLTTDEFWARDGSATHSTMKDKIKDALQSL